MIRIIYLKNRFDHRTSFSEYYPYERGKKLSEYIKDIPEIPTINDDYVIICNGKVIEPDAFIDNRSEIIITPKIKEPISTAIASISAWVAANQAIITTIQVIATLASVGYGIYSYLSAPKTPTFDSASDGLDDGSPTYGWDGISTQRAVNVPVPIVYGEHRVGGNVINEYISTDGDKNYLNTLLALCEGEIESISDIEINGNPIANFDGVTQSTRLGTNNQTIITGFEDLHNVIPINIELLQNSAYTYTTVDSDVEGFEVKINFPSGLFQQNESTGKISSWSSTVKFEYKLTTSGVWITAGTVTFSGKTQTTMRRYFRKDGLTAGKYDIRVTKTSENSSFYKTGATYIQSIDEIKTDNLSYPNTALLGLDLLASEQLSGSSPNITCVVKGRKVSAPYVLNGGSPVDWEDYYWNTANSEFRLLSDDTSLTWDGTTYTDQYCANPIWCMKDLITNSRYGLGEYIDSSLIDNDLFLEMAKYCEEAVDDGTGTSTNEKRFTLNVVLDSFTSALDLIAQITTTFNCFTYYSEGAIKLKIDKAETPVQVFGMGNIVEGSFTQSWKSTKEIPNVLEVQFLDKDKNYENETIAVTNESSITNGEPLRKKTIRVFTTKMSEAIRLGRYALNVARYIDQTISFQAGIDAIACQVGDLIDVSHDVPLYGFSGRVVSGTTTTVTLDRTVTVESGKSYKVQVRFADDTIEESTVTDSAGDYTTLNVSPAFSQAPANYDVYAFGESDIQTKPYRIVGISRDNNDLVNITASEYDANVYDDTAIEIPQNNYSALSTDIPPVTNLALDEENVINGDGTIGSHINVSFELPTSTTYVLKRYKSAKIYISDNSGTTWTYAGETVSPYFKITEGLAEGTTYTVAVTTVSHDDEESGIASAPSDTILIQGKTLPPSDVTGFEISQNGDSLHFEWNAVTDVDLARYIVKKGSEWNTGTVIAELIDITTYDYPVGQIGSQTYMVKAVDTSGNESSNVASDTIIVTTPPEMNFSVDLDLFSANLDYKLTDVAIVRRNLYNPAYDRPTLSLDTATTWEEREAEDQGWEYQEANNGLDLDSTTVSTGTYEQITPFDLDTVFEFKVVIDSDYANASGGSVVYKIATSEDNATWTSFATISASSTYTGRYVKFQIQLSTSDTAQHIYLYNTIISIQAPSVVLAWGRDLAITSAGQTVNYGRTFTFPPRILSTIVNGIDGKVIIDNKTTTTFDVTVKDNAGSTLTTAEIDWEAKGY